LDDMRRHKVNTHERLAILPIADEVNSVVDPRKDPVLLRPPRGTHDAVRELGGAVAQSCRLDLGEEAAKLADDVGALEIDGELLEMADSVASGAYSLTTYGDLPAFAEILSRGGHSGTVAEQAAEPSVSRRLAHSQQAGTAQPDS
jgi:hypothetical protein